MTADPHTVRFAANLVGLRRARGVSQEDLAWDAGLHRTAISLLERAKRDPTLRTIEALAEALEVDPVVLLDGID